MEQGKPFSATESPLVDFDAVCQKVRAAVEPARAHAVSLHDQNGEVLWLSESSMGPDEHNAVRDALDAFAKGGPPILATDLGDARSALLLRAVSARRAIVGVIMIVLDTRMIKQDERGVVRMMTPRLQRVLTDFAAMRPDLEPPSQAAANSVPAEERKSAPAKGVFAELKAAEIAMSTRAPTRANAPRPAGARPAPNPAARVPPGRRAADQAPAHTATVNGKERPANGPPRQPAPTPSSARASAPTTSAAPTEPVAAAPAAPVHYGREPSPIELALAEAVPLSVRSSAAAQTMAPEASRSTPRSSDPRALGKQRPPADQRPPVDQRTPADQRTAEQRSPADRRAPPRAPAAAPSPTLSSESVPAATDARGAITPEIDRLHAALRRSPIALHVQHLVPLAKGSQLKRYEVLLRSKGDDAPNAAPHAMLRAAVDNGLGSMIDRRVVTELIGWLVHHPDVWQPNPVMFSVNLTATALQDEHFIKFVELCLAKSSLPAGTIAFELEVSTAAKLVARAFEVAEALHRLHCPLVLDDFALRTECFDMLRLPGVRYLKLSSDITAKMRTDKLSQASITAVAQMARVLGMHTVAKRTESPAEQEWLTALGVDFVQSHALSPPALIDSLSRGPQLSA
jgi:EAL domain-containing protein (putative c-di-GMP-specific phosphodiesterase class I)